MILHISDAHSSFKVYVVVVVVFFLNLTQTEVNGSALVCLRLPSAVVPFHS